jgi:TRAP-type transport system small permease protein
MKKLRRFISVLETVLEYFACSCLVLMTVIITYQIFMRYFFSATPGWSEELALLLMVWFAFIGMAIGVRRRNHLSIEFLVAKLSNTAQAYVAILNELLILAFGAILFIFGVNMMITSSMSTMAALRIPNSFLYLMVPVSGFLMMIYTIDNLITAVSDIFFRKDIWRHK